MSDSELPLLRKPKDVVDARHGDIRRKIVRCVQTHVEILDLELLVLEFTSSCFTVVAMYIAGWLSQSAYHLQNLLLSLENEETVYFLQNIPIKGSSVHCRTL